VVWCALGYTYGVRLVQLPMVIVTGIITAKRRLLDKKLKLKSLSAAPLLQRAQGRRLSRTPTSPTRTRDRVRSREDEVACRIYPASNRRHNTYCASAVLVAAVAAERMWHQRPTVGAYFDRSDRPWGVARTVYMRCVGTVGVSVKSDLLNRHFR